MATLISSLFTEPVSDGDKSDFTAYGAATDFQAVTKAGVRSPTVPANTSGVRSSTHDQIDRFNFTVPAPPPGQFLNWVRLWAYYEAVPANHTIAQNARALLSGGGGHGVSVAAGQTGWRVSGKHSPFKAGPALLAPGDTVSSQFQLAESAAQAADTDITAVHMEWGYSSIEHTIVFGRGIVGASSGRVYQWPFAGYASLAFDAWPASSDAAGQRAVIREMVSGGLELCRIFIPFGDMMTNETTVNAAAWTNFETFLEICREEGLRLVVTGIVTFVTDHRPVWLDALSEANRWATFRRWWDRCARACACSPCVVAYDLINEPFGQDGGSTWYLGGPPFDWGSYLCKNLSGRTAADVLTAFMAAMRDVASVGIAEYDLAKPRGVGIPITGTYGGGTLEMSWGSCSENQILFPHLYLWANAAGSMQSNLADIALMQAFYNKPIILQETGLLDGTYSEAQLLDFLKRAHDLGVTGVAGGWKGLFDSFAFSTGYKLHQRLMPIVKGRIRNALRVGGVRGRNARIGQRTR
jgi:hypothetical protein